MALKNYSATSLIGGGAGALDAIDGTNLQDLDSAKVDTVDTQYFYTLDADSAAAESSPNVISPDTNAGNKRWILVFSAGISGVLTLSNVGLHILDTNASHDLIVKPGSNLTADRTWTVTTGDANRATIITADITLDADLTGGVKDEDSMSSDSATAIATQQSIKAYADRYQQGVPGFTTRPKFVYCESLDYTSGGIHELVAGDTVTGETGGATGYVEHITLTSGAWADGDAAGTLYLTTRTGTFQSETLKDNGNLNCASIGGASSKNAVVIYPFVYHHEGTTEQLVYSDSKIGYEFTSLGVSDWSYFYLDDSAIVTAGTNVISSTELVDATTEPSYSASKHGEYNGNDKCIFAVFTDGSSNILEFFHEGDLCLFANNIIDLSLYTDIDTTWTDVTLTIPKFATGAQVIFSSAYITANAVLYYRPDGQTGTTGHRVIYASTLSGRGENTIRVITSSAQKIEIKSDASNDAQFGISTDGWYFPKGL